MRVLELKIPPPIVALLIGAAMWLGAGRGPALTLPLSIRVTIFLVITLLGGVVALAGDTEFKRAKTTINPFRPQHATTLVTSGIYRFSRNPMYLGLTLVVLGWAAFIGSAIALLGPAAFVLYIVRFQIVPEERALAAKFGAAYLEYTSHVRRWL